jgi:cytochrome c biogenesis protein CcmG, thiol:disulfide interchange protein DsbE
VVSSPPRRGDAARKAEQQRRIRIVLGAILAVAVVVGIAYLSIGELGSRVTLEEVEGDPTIEGDALPAAPDDPNADPAVGAPAPIVRGADFDGTPVAIGEPGRPQLVMFLASWCPVCQDELPEVVEWQAAGGVPDGVDLVAVSTGLDPQRPEWPPNEWFDREGWTGPTLVDDGDGSVAQAYGLRATPYWVVLDADGAPVARISGRIPLDTLSTIAASLVGDA